jgi:hypothetical protein
MTIPSPKKKNLSALLKMMDHRGGECQADLSTEKWVDTLESSCRKAEAEVREEI